MALVTAERLHRWKCVYCGSKDKNIMDIKALKTRNAGSTKENMDNAIKIVTCSQCGKTEIFAHSAKMLATALFSNAACSIEDSEEFVKKFHMINHDDPQRNPHNNMKPLPPKDKPDNENT